MKPNDIITMTFTLPEGKQVTDDTNESRILQGWITATIASCDYQGIGCVVTVNGKPYKPDTERITAIREALKDMESN